MRAVESHRGDREVLGFHPVHRVVVTKLFTSAASPVYAEQIRVDRCRVSSTPPPSRARVPRRLVGLCGRQLGIAADAETIGPSSSRSRSFFRRRGTEAVLQHDAEL